MKRDGQPGRKKMGLSLPPWRRIEIDDEWQSSRGNGGKRERERDEIIKYKLA